MAMSLALGLGLGMGGAVAAAAIPGVSASVYATTPNVQYHPNSQSGGGSYTKSGSTVTGCPSLGSTAAAMSGFGSDGTTPVGPEELTDGLGRKFWRFNGSSVYATIDNAMSGIGSRSFTIVLVARVPHQGANINFVNPRYAAYTNDTTNTVANASIGLMRATQTSSGAPFLGAQTTPDPTVADATNCWKLIPSTGLQVMTIASRTTANGGQRIFVNGQSVDIGQAATSVSNYLGGIIAGTGAANNSNTVTTSANNCFDLYELAIWVGSEMSNANVALNDAAANTNWGTVPFTSQLVLAGDSITQGVATALAVSPAQHGSAGTRLTDPGLELVPATCRVLNVGASGDKYADAVTKRDNARSLYQFPIPGGWQNNLVAVQLARNDAVITASSAPIIYASACALWNTATSGAVGGYLQKGFGGFQMGPIATGASAVGGSPPEGAITVQQRIVNLRALFFTNTDQMHATFKTDTLTDTGNTYDGRLGVIALHLVTVSGVKQWETTTVNAPTGPYNTDNTHLVTAGCQTMATGGDTPQYGYGVAV